MVLFVFAIMVLIPGKEETGPTRAGCGGCWRCRRDGAAAPAGGHGVTGRGPAPGRPPATGNVETIGRLLFTDYLFPFELTSVLLLAAMVGVLLLARRRA
jgi:NADH:ubiquinone oxidoreductase subunit 6 (subunit J)